MASEAAAVDVEIDNEESSVDKTIEKNFSKKDNGSASGDVAAAAGVTKRKSKKLNRQNSKENSMAGGFIHGPRSWKNSRRSRNGYGRGLPKKGGAGGKGVWGVPGSELLEAYEDERDPNYDSENLSNGDIELKAVVPDISLEDLKKKVEPIVLEYFENGDTHEAALAIEDAIPLNHRDILVQLVMIFFYSSLIKIQ